MLFQKTEIFGGWFQRVFYGTLLSKRVNKLYNHKNLFRSKIHSACFYKPNTVTFDYNAMYSIGLNFNPL